VNDSGFISIRKDFYLGQPAPVNLQSSSAVGACAIFLNGISSSLQFHSYLAMNYAGLDNGSCGDALTPECALALQDLASAIVETEGGVSGVFTCDSLAQKLSETTPAACTLHPDLWVNISSKSESKPSLLPMKHEQRD
jgi:hypothetical protein